MLESMASAVGSSGSYHKPSGSSSEAGLSGSQSKAGPSGTSPEPELQPSKANSPKKTGAKSKNKNNKNKKKRK